MEALARHHEISGYQISWFYMRSKGENAGERYSALQNL
jgi:hypothetical protein